MVLILGRGLMINPPVMCTVMIFTRIVEQKTGSALSKVRESHIQLVPGLERA
jgi:hypothetical protein